MEGQRQDMASQALYYHAPPDGSLYQSQGADPSANFNASSDLEQDLQSMYSGFSHEDIEKEIHSSTTLNLDQLAKSVFADEKEKKLTNVDYRDLSSAYKPMADTCPETENEIMNLDMTRMGGLPLYNPNITFHGQDGFQFQNTQDFTLSPDPSQNSQSFNQDYSLGNLHQITQGMSPQDLQEFLKPKLQELPPQDKIPLFQHHDPGFTQQLNVQGLPQQPVSGITVPSQHDIPQEYLELPLCNPDGTPPYDTQDMHFSDSYSYDANAMEQLPSTLEGAAGEERTPLANPSAYFSSDQNVGYSQGYDIDLSHHDTAENLKTDSINTTQIPLIGKPFSEKNTTANLVSDERPSKLFKVNTPNGTFILKAAPIQTMQTMNSSPKQEMHLLAQKVFPVQANCSSHPSLVDQTNLPNDITSHPGNTQMKIPHGRRLGEHRVERKVLPKGEKKKKRGKELANVRSKDYQKRQQVTFVAKKEQENELEAKKDQLGHLCQSLESMSVNCHAIYHQYRDMMPPFPEELRGYIDRKNSCSYSTS